MFSIIVFKVHFWALNFLLCMHKMQKIFLFLSSKLVYWNKPVIKVNIPVWYWEKKITWLEEVGVNAYAKLCPFGKELHNTSYILLLECPINTFICHRKVCIYRMWSVCYIQFICLVKFLVRWKNIIIKTSSLNNLYVLKHFNIYRCFWQYCYSISLLLSGEFSFLSCQRRIFFCTINRCAEAIGFPSDVIICKLVN